MLGRTQPASNNKSQEIKPMILNCCQAAGIVGVVAGIIILSLAAASKFGPIGSPGIYAGMACGGVIATVAALRFLIIEPCKKKPKPQEEKPDQSDDISEIERLNDEQQEAGRLEELKKQKEAEKIEQSSTTVENQFDANVDNYKKNLVF